MTPDARLAEILEALQDIASGDFRRRLVISDAHDEVDAIAHAINVVAGELDYSTQRLSRARDEAERASAAKTLFLRNVSHELRTPASAIFGITQLLQVPGGVDTPQRNDLYARLITNVRAQIDLLDELLDLSQVESGKLTIEMRPIPVGPLLAQAVATLEPSAVQKRLALLFEPIGPQAELHVLGDRRRLHQIFVNVIGNAIKFTNSGQVLVQLARDGRDAIVDVADTGIGIDPAHVTSLFEPFTQADPGIAARFGGSGLGLALARALAREMAGDLVIVTTRPGAGTTVRLRLPEWQIPENSQSPCTPAGPSPSVSELEGICVLLADDHEDVRTSLARLLTLCGAAVSEARSGGEAIALGAGPGIDVILMDLRMPDINGLEATRRLRAMGVVTPIVALTADVVAERHDDGAYAGFTAQIAKPVDADRLVAMIRRLVRDRAHTRSPLAPR